MEQIDESAVAEFVKGKRIAVVGNAPEILTQEHGVKIDSHDIVLRMNGGMPKKSQWKALGGRTTILTVGKSRFLEGVDVPMVWWMKLTSSGQKQLLHIKSSPELYPKTKMWVWPQYWENAICKTVGSPPSTGIRVIDWISRRKPDDVSVFGVNWFGTMKGSDKSWWKDGGPAKAHSGPNEAQRFLELGFHERGPGWWVR